MGPHCGAKKATLCIYWITWLYMFASHSQKYHYENDSHLLPFSWVLSHFNLHPFTSNIKKVRKFLQEPPTITFTKSCHRQPKNNVYSVLRSRYYHKLVQLTRFNSELDFVALVSVTYHTILVQTRQVINLQMSPVLPWEMIPESLLQFNSLEHSRVKPMLWGTTIYTI